MNSVTRALEKAKARTAIATVSFLDVKNVIVRPTNKRRAITTTRFISYNKEHDLFNIFEGDDACAVRDRVDVFHDATDAAILAHWCSVRQRVIGDVVRLSKTRREKRDMRRRCAKMFERAAASKRNVFAVLKNFSKNFFRKIYIFLQCSKERRIDRRRHFFRRRRRQLNRLFHIFFSRLRDDDLIVFLGDVRGRRHASSTAVELDVSVVVVVVIVVFVVFVVFVDDVFDGGSSNFRE